jgi:hypothetical protein
LIPLYKDQNALKPRKVKGQYKWTFQGMLKKRDDLEEKFKFLEGDMSFFHPIL